MTRKLLIPVSLAASFYASSLEAADVTSYNMSVNGYHKTVTATTDSLQACQKAAELVAEAEDILHCISTNGDVYAAKAIGRASLSAGRRVVDSIEWKKLGPSP